VDHAAVAHVSHLGCRPEWWIQTPDELNVASTSTKFHAGKLLGPETNRICASNRYLHRENTGRYTRVYDALRNEMCCRD